MHLKPHIYSVIENLLESLNTKIWHKGWHTIGTQYVLNNNNNDNHQYLLDVSNESGIMLQLYEQTYPMRWSQSSLLWPERQRWMLLKSPAQGLPAWPLWLASIFSQFPAVTAHCSKSEGVFQVLDAPRGTDVSSQLTGLWRSKGRMHEHTLWNRSHHPEVC